MHNDNPYAAPQILDPLPTMVSTTQELQLAGQGARFVNFLLDQIFMQIFSGIAGFILGILYVVSRPNPAAISQQDEVSLNIMGTLLGLALAIAYYIILEATCQRTLAKFITGTKVVNAGGGAPTIGQIVGRTFARFIPFEVFSFFGNNGFPIGWHDSLSGTRVVKA